MGLFVLGLVFLIAGAEVLVRGASRLALAVGLSPLVIGLTVVAFGTSAPELAVSTQATFASGGEAAEIALGNVVGSNICNTLLILGLAAMIAPLHVQRQLVRLDVPLMILVSVVVAVMAFDQIIDRMDGTILFSGIIVYTAVAIYIGRQSVDKIDPQQLEAEKKAPIWLDVLYMGIGVAMLVVGSDWLVKGAVQIAEYLEFSKLVISITVVALGTSLPEVATSVVASIRGQRDIAVGNVIGSNIFNLLSVLGATAIVAPQGIPVPEEALYFDIPVMVAVAVLCFPIFLTNNRITRLEGGMFFFYYIAYTTYLLMAASKHEMKQEFEWVLGAGVIPLTILLLAFNVWRQFREGTSKSSPSTISDG